MPPRRVRSGSKKTAAAQKSRTTSTPVTFDTVRDMARTLDGAEEGTSYGTPAFRVRGTLFLRLREDGDSLIVRMEHGERDELLAADPDTYYITDHYLDYPWILVRLSRVHADALRDLLHSAWRLAGARKRKVR
jgi:hypothetical protein